MGTKIDITLSDGYGNSREFTDTQDLREFFEREQAELAWLISAPHVPLNMEGNYLNNYLSFITWIANVESGSWGIADLANHLAGHYTGGRPGVIFTDAGPGPTISAIRAAHGEALAERALALAAGKRDPQIADLDDFRAWQILATPALVGSDIWAEEQRRRWSDARDTIRRGLTKFRNDADALKAELGQTNEGEVARYRELATTALRLANRRLYAVQQEATNQVGLIEATRAAYEEQMMLQAPVQYWTDKKTAHQDAARSWLIALGVYFVTALIGGACAFSFAWTAVPDGQALSGKHFLLVAGVGALLTLVFWIARLLVRIYLGERHLHTDAEERRVMTQAYLALIKEKAATDQERIVILSALFRTAQDGIVKEDGAGDISLPAMIARLLDAKK